MYTYKAKLDRIVDGDTLDAKIDLGFDITVHKRIRLAGINTPESRTRDKEEKKRGLAAKDALTVMIEEDNVNNYFVLESESVGKFGMLSDLGSESPPDDNEISAINNLINIEHNFEK